VYSLSLLLVRADAQQNMQFLMRNKDANDHHWVWLVLIYSCQRIPALPVLIFSVKHLQAKRFLAAWVQLIFNVTSANCHFHSKETRRNSASIE
jgi:hypothetical protein